MKNNQSNYQPLGCEDKVTLVASLYVLLQEDRQEQALLQHNQWR